MTLDKGEALEGTVMGHPSTMRDYMYEEVGVVDSDRVGDVCRNCYRLVRNPWIVIDDLIGTIKLVWSEPGIPNCR